MVGYKILHENSEYCFALIEPNNNNQWYGKSVPFLSEQECRAKLKEFIDFLLVHRINDTWKDYCETESKDDKAIFRFYMGDQQILYRDKPFTGTMAKINCEECLQNIIDNAEEFLKSEK